MTQGVEIQVLGGFTATVAGESRGASLPRKLAALLGTLAAMGERGMARERLLHLLWSDADPDRARHALTQSLYALRRALGVEDLVEGTAHLMLNTRLVSTDLAALEHAIATGDGDAVARLYRGPLLDDAVGVPTGDFERWLEETRRALHHRVVLALDGAARTLRSRNEFAQESELLRRRVALDPLNAAASLAFMRALADAGDVPGAVQHARIYGELVRQDLELEPDSRVMEFANELQAASPPSPPPLVRRAASGDALAIGAAHLASMGPRAREMAARFSQLVRRWQRAVPRTLLRRAAGVATLGVVGLLALARYGAVTAREPGEPHGLAVMPFRPIAIAPDLAFLSNGMVELLGHVMAQADTVPVVPATSVLDLGGVIPDTASTDSLAYIARTLGASRFIRGTLVGNARQVVVRAELLDIGGETLATATASAPIDSLTSLVARLGTQLTAAVHGVSSSLGERLVSFEVLKAYVKGRDAYRRADWRMAQAEFERALDADSTFAAAAAGLALASDWLEDAERREYALTLADRNSTSLGVVERLQVEALRGTRYPSPSTAAEIFSAWERVARVGERAELWADLGRRLLLDGVAAGLNDASERASAAFERAVAMDSANTGFQTALAAAALARGDSVRLENSALPVPLRWRRALRTKDERQLALLRDGLDQADDDDLRQVARYLLSDAGAPADLARALDLRERRARSTPASIDAALAAHASALNGGHLGLLRGLRSSLAAFATSGADLRLAVLDALYGGADAASAPAVVRRLVERARSARALTDDGRRAALADLCVAEQWRAWHGDYSTLDASMALLRADTTGPGTVIAGVGGPACAMLLRAIREGLTPGGDERALWRAEEVALTGRAAGDMRQYAPLALARLRERRGDHLRALALVRRRSSSRGWPRYLATSLALEASLAERVQDSAAAAEALRRYLALRASPDDVLKADVAEARERLRRLEGGEGA